MTTTQALLFAFSFIMPLLYWRLYVYKKQKSQEFVTSKNLPEAFFELSAFSFLVRAVCLISAWVLLVLSSTSSQAPSSVSQQAQGVEVAAKKVDEIAFVLDLSTSMLAKDSSVGSSRLERAKEIIQSVIENLGGINCSLMVFTSSDRMLVPDTLDYLFFRIILDSVAVNETGSAGTNLLRMAEAVYKKYAGSPFQKNVLIVLLTDGEDTGFLGLSPQAKVQAERALLQVVSSSTRQQMITWNVIGLGSSSGSLVPTVTFEAKPVVSKLQTELLEQLAKAGRGHYFAESEVGISEIVDNILADVAVNQAKEASQVPITQVKPVQDNEERFLLLLGTLFLVVGICLPQNKARA